LTLVVPQRLPAEVRARFGGAVPVSLDRDALLAALKGVVEGVIQEARHLPEGAAKIEKRLRELV